MCVEDSKISQVEGPLIQNLSPHMQTWVCLCLDVVAYYFCSVRNLVGVIIHTRWAKERFPPVGREELMFTFASKRKRGEGRSGFSCLIGKKKLMIIAQRICVQYSLWLRYGRKKSQRGSCLNACRRQGRLELIVLPISLDLHLPPAWFTLLVPGVGVCSIGYWGWVFVAISSLHRAKFRLPFPELWFQWIVAQETGT